MRRIGRYTDVLVTIATAVILVASGMLLDLRRAADDVLVMGGAKFSAEMVSDDMALQKGLSGRDLLESDAAMVFVFRTADKWCFWMKDMRFALDIIWLDEAKQIVDIEPELSPDTYPRQFCPSQAARYVVEVNAGVAQQLNIKSGDQVSFSNL